MRMTVPMVAVAIVVTAGAPPTARAVEAHDTVTNRLSASAGVVKAMLGQPDKGIPQGLLDKAMCIAIVPSMKKAGFLVGGRYGKGVVVCRHNEGDGLWGNPSMLLVEGGSVGLQIGASSIDVVMLIMNPDGLNSLLKSEFTLGGDASVAAGPVGRAGTAETDVLMHAKILTWSRSRGLFAGLELKGAVCKHDAKANEELYGKEMEPADLLLHSKVATPRVARPLLELLERASPARR